MAAGTLKYSVFARENCVRSRRRAGRCLIGRETKKPAAAYAARAFKHHVDRRETEPWWEEEDRTPDLRIANRKVGLLFIRFLDSFLFNWDNFGTQR
jgi:hypothetical protein